MKKFYITTAIDYPNAVPHIGTAFEKIGADVQARYRRQKGYDVHFLMGNDENTLKVYKKAQELGKDTHEYLDEMAVKFEKVWSALNISHSDFYRTSDVHHAGIVEEFIERIAARNSELFYKKEYKSYYCPECEEFKVGFIPPVQTITGEWTNTKHNCPIHGCELEYVSEENYFFALTKFKGWLSDFHNKNPQFIQPESRRIGVYNDIDTLRDVSITRPNLPWGIDFPLDKTHKIYVWFDALLNYFGGSNIWPPDIHYIGKDITRFHCILWPAMLHAAGYELPKQVVSHGFVYKDGKKESKTGAATNPLDLVEKYGADAYRYYFMSKCSFLEDGSFNENHFKEVYNGELADNLGNLFSRVVGMVVKYFDGRIDFTHSKDWMKGNWVALYENYMENHRYSLALKLIWKNFTEGNQDIGRQEPWTLHKNGEIDKLRQLLMDQVNLLRISAAYLFPFMPTTAKIIINTFGLSYFVQINSDNLVNGKISPLFEKIK